MTAAAGVALALVGLALGLRLARTAYPAGLSAAAAVTIAAGSPVAWQASRDPVFGGLVLAGGAFAILWRHSGQGASHLRWALIGGLAGAIAAVEPRSVPIVLLPIASVVDLARFERRRGLHAAIAVAEGLAVGAGVAWLLRELPGLGVARGLPETAGVAEAAEVLWSSRGGLLATAPALYLAVAGLALAWRRHARLARGGLALVALTALTAGAPASWAPGRFALDAFGAAAPFFVFGLAACFDAVGRAVVRRPAVAAAGVLAPLVVWNVTLAGAAKQGAYRIGQPVSFAALGEAQAGVLHDWIGHPWSYPLVLVDALATGLAPGRFDVLRPARLLAGRSGAGAIDVGAGDGDYVLDGWHAPEADGARTFRWSAGSSGLVVPLDRPVDAVVTLAAAPFEVPGAPTQRMTLVVNGRRLPAVELASGWGAVAVDAPAGVWRAGVNRVRLEFTRAIRPADLGGADPRPLAAAVDRIDVRRRGP